MSYEFKGTPGPWERCDAEAIVGKSGHGWFVRVSNKRVISVEGRTEIEAEANAQLIAAAPDIFDALAFAERRSKQPGEGHTEYFERIAEEFYHRHGFLAPGKDDPFHNVSDKERRDTWEKFLAEPADARRAALAKATGGEG